MMTEVILHGALGKHVGRSRWKLAVNSPAEALHLIEANTGRVFDFLKKDAENNLAGYRVLLNEKDIVVPDQLQLPTKKYTKIEFVPVAAGAAGNSGLAIGLIVVGVILLIVAAFTYGATGVAAAKVFAVAATLGVSLLLSGIIQLISPSPEQAKNKESKSSYLFNGAVNTTRQGNPVPLGYGQMLIGSQVISSGIHTREGVRQLPPPGR